MEIGCYAADSFMTFILCLRVSTQLAQLDALLTVLHTSARQHLTLDIVA